MAGREAYTSCMIPFMKGGGPDRKLRFCTGAKICSGKAASEEEARQICLSQPPKEPKKRKSRKTADCSKEMAVISACLTPLLNAEEELTVSRLTEMLQQCACGKVEKVEKIKDKKQFIKECYRKNPIASLKEFSPVRKMCLIQWDEHNS